MTKENSKTVEMLPFEVIAAATQGDTDALCKVLERYDGYIVKLSTRIARDEYGNSFLFVDEEIDEIFQTRKRIEQSIKKFRRNKALTAELIQFFVKRIEIDHNGNFRFEFINDTPAEKEVE